MPGIWKKHYCWKKTKKYKQANKCEKNGKAYRSSPKDLYRTREKNDAVKLF